MSDNTPRLQKKYTKDVVSALTKKFGYSSVMEVPKLQKIKLNIGVGEAIQDAKALEGAANDLTVISGKKPAYSTSKKSISNFKLRQGMKIGVHSTLRREYMWEFLDRFVAVTVPRIRDFRGFPDKSFDGLGNYSMGIQEQIVFAEINMDKIDKIRGLDITFVTTAKTDEEAYELLKLLGFPFVKHEK